MSNVRLPLQKSRALACCCFFCCMSVEVTQSIVQRRNNTSVWKTSVTPGHIDSGLDKYTRQQWGWTRLIPWVSEDTTSVFKFIWSPELLFAVSKGFTGPHIYKTKQKRKKAKRTPLPSQRGEKWKKSWEVAQREGDAVGAEWARIWESKSIIIPLISCY